MTETTELLLRWSEGESDARDSLLNRLYPELTRVAGRHLANESAAMTLQPHALVHEAYIRLVEMDRVQWRNRAHFFALSARLMRQILIDAARKRNAAKRNGGIRVTLAGISSGPDQLQTDVLMLHGALEKLAAVDADRAHLVELRFFGGLTIRETAEVLDLSPATVKRRWEVARGWLYREMKTGPDSMPSIEKS